MVLKSVALRTGSELWDRAARFWGRIFAINFVFGVVTGIPMEFEFGTNWARFSRLSGGVIGQPLAMEGVFSFFLESAFLGLFLYGEKRISKRMHWFSAVMVLLGSWISGFFIIVTDAWMQHPVAYDRLPDGHFEVLSFWQLLLNPWGLLQYMHNMTGAVVTGSLRHGRRRRVLSAGRPRPGLRPHLPQGRRHRRRHLLHPHHLSHRRPAGKYVARNQPAAIAAMEGLFKTETGARHRAHGPAQRGNRPDRQSHRRQQRAQLPHLRHHQGRSAKASTSFPRDQWPTALPLLYYAYHIMAGLGTWFVLLMVVSASCSGAGVSTPRAGCCGRCCSAFRCPTSPTPPAG